MPNLSNPVNTVKPNTNTARGQATDLRSQLADLQNPNSNEGERSMANWMVEGGRPGEIGGNRYSASSVGDVGGAGAGAGSTPWTSGSSSGIQSAGAPVSSSSAPAGPGQTDSWSPERGFYRPGTAESAGGGSGSGSGSGNGSDVTADTPVNPLQKHAYDAASNYESGLASGTNEEITRELQRARDDVSVGMDREGTAAMSRGADPSFFKSRALEAGKRDIHALQGRLADVALGRREGAVRTLSETAGSAAGEQRMMHLGTMSARLGEQRAALDASELQARLREAPYQRLQSMMDSVGRYRDMLGDGQSFTSSGPVSAPVRGGTGSLRAVRPMFG